MLPASPWPCGAQRLPLKRSDADPLRDGALRWTFYANYKSPTSSGSITFSIADSAGIKQLPLNGLIGEKTKVTWICIRMTHLESANISSSLEATLGTFPVPKNTTFSCVANSQYGSIKSMGFITLESHRLTCSITGKNQNAASTLLCKWAKLRVTLRGQFLLGSGGPLRPHRSIRATATLILLYSEHHFSIKRVIFLINKLHICTVWSPCRLYVENALSFLPVLPEIGCLSTRDTSISLKKGKSFFFLMKELGFIKAAHEMNGWWI